MPRSRSRSGSRSNTRSTSPVKRRRSASPVEAENVGEIVDHSGCPFLIRLFVTKGRHTAMIDFDEGRLPLQDEFQAYGWKTSTPSSLIQLLLPSFPAPYRSPLARYSFRHIYVDASPRGLYRNKDLVSFTGRDLMLSVPTSGSGEDRAVHENDDRPEGKNGMDMDVGLDDMPVPSSRAERSGGAGGGEGRKIDEKTLDEYGFVTGDLLSVSLHIPEARGLRRPTGTGSGSGPGNTGLAGNGGASGPGVPGVPGDRGNFGWQNGSGGQGQGGPATGAGGADKTGQWERGAPLPPQNNARPGARQSFGGNGGGGGGGADAPGKWGRGGGGGGGAGMGMGIRGQGQGQDRRRSRSPDYTAGGARDDARGDRGGRRSRSPEHRRESWASRR